MPTRKNARSFRERSEFFFQYSVNKLLTMPTRTLCRPVVLLLSNGLSRAWHEQHPEARLPGPDKEVIDFGEPELFVPQKAKALKRLKQLVVASFLLGISLLGWLDCSLIALRVQKPYFIFYIDFWPKTSFAKSNV